MSREIRRSQGMLTPQVDTYQADLSQSNVTASVADYAFKTADVLQQKAEHKYELEFKNQAQEQINDIYTRNQTNPAQFQKEIKEVKKVSAKNAPFYLKADFDTEFDIQVKPYLNKVTDNHDKKLTDEIKFSTLKRMDLAQQSASVFAGELFSGNPARAAEASKSLQGLLNDSVAAVSATDAAGMPVFSASERFKASKDFIDNVAFTSTRAGYDEAVNKEDFINRFKSGELKAQIFLDEQGNFTEQSVRDGMDRQSFERTLNYMEADFEKLKRESKEAQERQDNIQAVNAVLSGEGILDPMDDKSKKAVSQYFDEAIVPSLENAPQAQRNETIIDYVSNTGIYPKSLESSINAQLSNGTFDQRVQAADLVNNIAERNPQTVLQISDSVRSRARAITDNINAGIPPELAVEYAEKSVFQKDTPEYKARLDRFTDKKNGERVEFNPSDFTSVYRSDPSEIPDAMKADYDLLQRTYYMEGGVNAKSAAELAKQKVEKQWKITTADGRKRWMKYAPEAMYENEAGTDWIGRQLQEEVGKIGSLYETGKEPELLLSVIPDSVRRGKPAYAIFQLDEYGVPQPFLTQNGKQAAFTPNYFETSEYKNDLEEYNGDKKAAMIAARRRRTAKLSRIEQEEQNKAFKRARGEAFKSGVESLLGMENDN